MVIRGRVWQDCTLFEREMFWEHEKVGVFIFLGVDAFFYHKLACPCPS